MANETYSTPDTGLGAFLTVKGYHLRRTFGRDGSIWFEFEVDGRDIAADVADFFAGTDDEVSASRYNAASRRLSKTIRDQRR